MDRDLDAPSASVLPLTLVLAALRSMPASNLPDHSGTFTGRIPKVALLEPWQNHPTNVAF